MSRTSLLRLGVCCSIPLFAASQKLLAIAAFPGAEGFGANAVGGRGGDVYHVTTLDPDVNHVIPGSLNYGLYNKNVPGSGTVPGVGRTIVFDVGGTIYCNTGTITFKDIHNITIAGQTAPGPGITIIGDTFGITGNDASKATHDIIVRYLTVRKGSGNGDDGMHVQGTGNTHDVILDHISGSWSEDEVISATQTATNVTVQNSIMSEALTSNHAYGSLIRPTVNSQISYVRNLYSNQKSRNPRPGTYNGMTLDFEFQNNVIYNWSDRAGYIAGADTDVQHLNMNYVGNYLIAGPATVDGTGTASSNTRRSIAFYKEVNNDPLDLHFWQSDNKIDSNNNSLAHGLDGVDTGWNMFRTISGSTVTPFPDADKVASRFNYPMSSPDSPDVAYQKVLATVGAFPQNRSAVDRRLINDVINYTGNAPITAPDPTEWSNLVNQPMVSRPAGWDTDQDGMPNYWETMRGTNPNIADNNGTLAGNGYTNLENYLNSLTFVANWNLNANGNWSGILNWAGAVPNSSYATANFGPGITAPLTVTVDVPVTISDISFDSSSFGYTIGGSATVTLDALSGYSTINVNSGSHTIAAPVVLANDVLVTVTPVAAQLVFTGPVNAAGRSITKVGAGAVQFENVQATALNVNAGLVRISAKAQANSPAGLSHVQSLAISPGAQLDLTNNSMLIDFSGSPTTPLNTTRQHLASGRLTSSSADATHRLGYGVSGGSSVLVKFTYAGDADLDGDADGVDIGTWATNFTGEQGGSGVSTWSQGDWDYDGDVDGVDAGLWAEAFTGELGGNGLGSIVVSDPSISPQAAAILEGIGITVVPEPASLGMLGVIVICSLGRRARTRQRKDQQK